MPKQGIESESLALEPPKQEPEVISQDSSILSESRLCSVNQVHNEDIVGYVEFSIRQQRDYDKCMIGKKIVMQPIYLIC